MRALLTLAFGLALFCACENPAEEDAGPADTGVMVVDTGVRDSGPGDTGGDVGISDGGQSDAAPIDADPTDSEPTDVATNDGGPRTGPVTVIFEDGSPFGTTGLAIFHDATGAVRATRTTTVGIIVETIEEGWMVTLGASPTNNVYLYTITEIAPNETYKVASYPIDLDPIANMYFGIGTPYATADTYWLEAGCNSSGLSSDPSYLLYASVRPYCVTSAQTMDYVVLARDQNLDRLAFKLIEDVPVVQGSTVTPPDPWRTDFAQANLEFLNAPAEATFMYLEGSVRSNGGRYDYDGESVPIVTGSALYAMIRPPFGDGVDTVYRMESPNSESRLQSPLNTLADRTYDLSTEFLPFPGPVTVTPSPIVGRLNASWPAAPTDVDFVEIAVMSRNLFVRWTVIVRGSATTLMLPELPASVAPEIVDLTELETGMRTIDAEAWPDYATARETIGRSVTGWASLVDVYDDPPPGQVRSAGLLLDFK